MEKETAKVTKRFEDTLNRNGFGFQYAVIKKIEDLFNDNNLTAIYPEFAEVPVQVIEGNTHIDIVLRRKSTNSANETPLYLIAECKQANPAYCDWCFIRAPFTKRTGFNNSLLVESLRFRETTMSNLSQTETILKTLPQPRDDFFQIGTEIKTDKKGDPTGGKKGAIDDAIPQVLKGLNGFIDFLLTNDYLMDEETSTYLLPVVFTTAQLWTIDADLSSADLFDGNIDLSTHEMKKCNWLFYEYNQSPTFKMKNMFSKSFSQENDLSNAITTEYSRTIAIVNSLGIEEFIIWVSNLRLPS